jgi:NADH:ubiquinone reductase (H+-translocating)
MMDEVLSIDRATREVQLQHQGVVPFDVLIVAPGSRHSYFGHDAWEPYAPGLKTMADAVRLRERMLLAFEDAERTGKPLTFVIIGGGPTGVELAGALAEIGRRALGPDFPSIRLEDLTILLVEAGPRILAGFSPDLSDQALDAMQRMGVTIKLNSPVSDICPEGLTIGEEFVRTTNILWAAGNKASPLLASLGVPQDAAGRVKVLPDLSIPGDADIFVIGDAAHCAGPNGAPLPGVAHRWRCSRAGMSRNSSRRTCHRNNGSPLSIGIAGCCPPSGGHRLSRNLASSGQRDSLPGCSGAWCTSSS